MAKAIVIPDSFKGSMSSVEVATILADKLREKTEYDVVSLPIADGGEGSTECILKAVGGSLYTHVVKSPERKDIEASFGITSDGVGVVEIAQSSGITRQTSYNAMEATTYGFGQLIKAALDKGARKFYLCLGGSATTDGGCGMAAALGVTFINRAGEAFVPVGGTLKDIEKIDLSTMDSRVQETEFIVMSDVENPLYGPLGAAHVYAAQKGATPEQIIELDAGLQHFGDLLGDSYENLPGAGAAGGAGCGCAYFLHAVMQSGIEAMLSLCHFDKQLKDCELILTGEGKLDRQSLMGKVLSGIRKHSGSIPIVSFCGISEADADILKKQNISVVEIGRGVPLEDSMKNGKEYLEKAFEEWIIKWTD